jgi:hypothetical protein
MKGLNSPVPGMETVIASSPVRVIDDYNPQAANRGELLEHPARTRKRHKARAKASNYCDLLPATRSRPDVSAIWSTPSSLTWVGSRRSPRSSSVLCVSSRR